jgi:hypothetical protein
MSTDNLSDLIDRVRDLPLSDQVRLLSELRVLIAPGDAAQAAHSILEIKGLGHEVWDGMDAQEYVDRERGTWNG